MNNPASSGGPIVALALTPPYIPSQTYPIIHPVAQVGLSRLNYYADSKGLLVLFGPYLDQEPDETGRIYLNGLPVPTPAQTTVDKTSPLRFLVPPGLLSNGVNNLKVNLQRQSGNEDSSELSVLHSLVAPAGNDPDPTPGNSLLNIDVTPKSIGPAEAAAGVKLTMSYLGMALYDLLTINYGGKTLTHQIVPTAQDPNPETKPVVLTFKTADFAHAPNNPQFIFKYNVISQIDDFSGTSSNGVFNPQEFWSKELVVDVHLDRVERNPPIIVEAEPGKVLDVTALNGKDATIHGLIWTGIAVGQQVWLKLTGQKPDSSAATLQIWNGGANQVNATWVSQGFWPKPLPASFLSQLRDASSLRMEFWVSEDKSNNFATATKFADQVYTVKASSVTITSYTDSANTSVSNGGWTYETGGTLTGTAGSNQQVQILLNGTVRQTVTANAAGIWNYSISGLAVFFHTFIARPLPVGADSTKWLLDVRLEWQDHYTSLADSYNGWIPYAGARSGSIRPFLMANQWVTAFFNFTDQGAPTGFAGAIFYHDFLFIPGQYHFTFEGTHVADSPNPQLVNPILCADTGMVQWPGDRRVVPKNGVWYLFLNAFTITQRQVARLYVSNFQDGSNGNDFGIRNIRVVRLDSGGGVMSAPVVGPEAPIYTGPLPDLVYP
ncbi:hypothetical protein [Pseudomonas sp. UV AK001]|uniref:hypothetical protein n=1 Tax=Pseudomonas sp. UV AK001 TaxID=3384791 RepID=UPI0038D44C85